MIQDDALFMRLAANILRGEWLGPFDNLTLAKGPFYPLFIAGSHLVGLPLKVAEQLLHLGCAGVAAFVIWRFSRSRKLSVAAFALLGLNPFLWHPIFARVLRENIYIGESLALVALAALIAFEKPASERDRIWRIVLLFVFGLVFAAYWLTREESSWLYPSLAVVAIGAGVQRYLDWRASSKPTIAWLDGAASVAGQGAIAFGGFAALAGTIATLNYNAYGVFLTNEMREGNLESAYGAIMRIKPDVWAPYVFFPQDVASRAYAVSPAAAQLRRGLEGQSGKDYRAWGCRAVKISPCPAAFVGAWFMWAMRDAVRDAGYYASAEGAQKYYARLAEEINAACDTNKISCLSPRSTMAPPFYSEYLGPGLRSFANSLRVLAIVDALPIGTAPSKGREDQIAIFRDLGGVTAPLDTNPQSTPPSTVESISSTAMRVASELYRVAMWLLVLTGAAGLTLAGLRYRSVRSNLPLITLAVAAAGAVFTRAVLVAYIDVSSWFAVNELYLSPGSPFVALFGITGTFVGIMARRQPPTAASARVTTSNTT